MTKLYKMQKVSFSLLTFLMIVLGLSCTEEGELPFDGYQEFGRSGFARLVDTDGRDFFFADPEGSVFNFDVEYVAEDNGKQVASHEWIVIYKSGEELVDTATVITVQAEDFGLNEETGLPTASYTFSMLESLDILERSVDDLKEGDQFIYEGYITMRDGRVFGPDDTGQTIQISGEPMGVWRIVKEVRCISPLDGLFAAKTFVTEQMIDEEWDICLDSVWTGFLRFESLCNNEIIVSSITEVIRERPDETMDTTIIDLYDMTLGAYNACYQVTLQSVTPNGDAAGTDPTLVFTYLDDVLAYEGQSQWGEFYALDTVFVDDMELTIEWTNTAGEGARTIITREEGFWPPISK